MISGSALISGYFDGTLSDAEVAELNAWIVADPANARLFAKHAILHQQIGGVLSHERGLRIANQEASQEHRAGQHSHGPATTEFYRSSSRASDRLAVSVSAAPKMNRWKLFVRSGWAAAAVLVVVCGMLAVEHFRNLPAASPDEEEAVANNAPAFITGDAGAVWKESSDDDQRDVALGQSLTLSAGYVEVTFAGGAKVVVEGPSTFTVNSATAMSLSSGKLAATVIGGGFVVNTPGAKVTDLGTEFGVAVQNGLGTSVEVFKGRVQLETAIPANGTGPANATHILYAGDNATLSNGTFAMNAAGTSGNFLRDLSTMVASLDVVDLINGGSGTTHRRGLGIDVTTGEAGDLKQTARESGDDHYHRITSLPAVDGVFVPDGAAGEQQIDSAGDKCKFLSMSKLTQGLLSAGGRPLDPFGNGLAGTMLGGTDYSESGHAALFMNSNKGVTLDLKAIRAMQKKGDLYEFRCTVGNTYLKMMHEQRTFPRADIYVLVDGQIRFKRMGFVAKNGPFTVKVPLTRNDHFLTLATTDGGDTRKDDYVIFGDPAFQIMRSPFNGGAAGR